MDILYGRDARSVSHHEGPDGHDITARVSEQLGATPPLRAIQTAEGDVLIFLWPDNLCGLLVAQLSGREYGTDEWLIPVRRCIAEHQARWRDAQDVERLTRSTLEELGRTPEMQNTIALVVWASAVLVQLENRGIGGVTLRDIFDAYSLVPRATPQTDVQQRTVEALERMTAAYARSAERIEAQERALEELRSRFGRVDGDN